MLPSRQPDPRHMNAVSCHSTLGFEDLYLENQLCLAMYNATNRITHIYDVAIERFGLSYPQLVCMMALWQKSPRTVTEISRSLDIGKGTITTLILRLQSKGLLVRERDDVDERCFNLRLTPMGLALREPVQRARREVACTLAVTADELDGLKDQLNRLHRILADAA